MTILSIPALLASSAGGRLSLDTSTGSNVLGRMTIANVDQGTVAATSGSGNFTTLLVNETVTAGDGTNATKTVLTNVTVETLSSVSLFSDTLSTVLGGSTVEPTTIALIISVCDAACVVALLCFIIWYRGQIGFYAGDFGAFGVSASDYTVFVRGLPKDATKEEILNHFNGLYALDHPDWTYKGHCFGCWGTKLARHPEDITDQGIEMHDAHGNAIVVAKQLYPKPVSNLDHVDGDALYTGSWVAEVSVAHPIGKAIRLYQKAKNMTLKLMGNRAKVKRHLDKANDDSLRDSTRRKAEGKAAKGELRVEALEISMHNFKETINHAVRDLSTREHQCEAAFVVFNNEESVLRCLEDYARYQRWPVSKMQPVPLRFRGTHILHVRRADEPTDVFWENLETHHTEKCARVCSVWFVSLVLVLLSAVGVLAATRAKIDYKATLPDTALCRKNLPATYMGVHVYDLQRSVNATEIYPVRFLDKDSTCAADAAGNKQYYIDYPGTVRDPGASHASCLNPCVSMDSADTCNTTACDIANWPNPTDCDRNYKRATITACYCKGMLQNYTSLYGFVEGPAQVYKDPLCQTWVNQFVLQNSLYYLVIVGIVVVNALLKIVLRNMSYIEHWALASETVESMTIKITIVGCTAGGERGGRETWTHRGGIYG